MVRTPLSAHFYREIIAVMVRVLVKIKVFTHVAGIRRHHLRRLSASRPVDVIA